jgi:hypothetical protein
MDTIGYQWRIKGRELAGGTCRDSDGSGVADCLDSVVEGVTGALRRHYQEEGPDVLANILYTFWGPLRHSVLTDGDSATRKSGGSWEGSAGPINVRIWAL